MTKIKNLKNREQQWQKDRKSFYENSTALRFIDLYFKVKKGVRCIAGHVENYKYPSYYKHNDTKDKLKMMTLPDADNNTYWHLKHYYCIHSFQFIFDKRVLEWMNMFKINEKKEMGKVYIETIIDNIIGLCPVLDIDAPVDPLIFEQTGKEIKLNFFDHIDSFNDAINIIHKTLEREDTRYNKLFTGNGLKIELESCYAGINGDIDTVLDYAENFKNLFQKLQDDKLGDKFKVHICNSSIPWNDYFKCPFSFHEKMPRITLPLPKGDIDAKWLDRVSNVNNVMKDYNIIDEIIDKCDNDWEVLW